MSLIIVMAAITWQANSGIADDASRAGRLVLVAGGGSEGDGASADRARVTSPFGVGFDAKGTLYFVEMLGHRVRKIGPDGHRHDAGRVGPRGERRRRRAGNSGRVEWSA